MGLQDADEGEAHAYLNSLPHSKFMGGNILG